MFRDAFEDTWRDDVPPGGVEAILGDMIVGVAGAGLHELMHPHP
jgi:hypothetical protein